MADVAFGEGCRSFHNLLTWSIRAVKADGTVFSRLYKRELKIREVRQDGIVELLRSRDSCLESQDTASRDRSALAQWHSAAQGAPRGSSSFSNSVLMGVVSLPTRANCCLQRIQMLKPELEAQQTAAVRPGQRMGIARTPRETGQHQASLCHACSSGYDTLRSATIDDKDSNTI